MKKDLILEFETGTPPKYKKWAKEATEKFVSLFPEYKNSLVVKQSFPKQSYTQKDIEELISRGLEQNPNLNVQEIWNNSPQFAELRKITQASFPKCLQCEARDYCHLCLVQNYNESNGDMFRINPYFCEVAFMNKRLVKEYKAKLQKK